ncbi:hypothetical protein JRQ81_019385 [Phrynocephalus forsythii]|uniref:Uncharacterized protein n=1 Tax=Phrynocephalus forsythii TaxID=171643 RepID=A0A9Q0XMA8_9SAUR|nr:hypothetical protein JRQ81_019385 [Phrynocephalus forsythii]
MCWAEHAGEEEGCSQPGEADQLDLLTASKQKAGLISDPLPFHRDKADKNWKSLLRPSKRNEKRKEKSEYFESGL